MKKLLILAILLRVLVASFFFHPDIKEHYFHSSFLKQGVVDLYKFIEENKADLPISQVYSYPPLPYFFLGLYESGLSYVLGPNFDNWISDFSPNNVQNTNIFSFLLLLKLPYLLFDVLTAFLLLNFFKNKKLKQKAFLIWLFNPITIFLIYAYSSFDIIPVFLSLLSLYLLRKQKFIISAITLSLAICFKLYPLIFLPFWLLSINTVKQKSTFLMAVVATLFMILVPFYSTAFFDSVLNSGLTSGFLSLKIPLFFGQSVSIVLLAVFALISLFSIKKDNLPGYLVSLFVIIFCFSRYHIQWILWMLPFVVLILIKRPKAKYFLVLFLLILFLIPLFYEDKAMTTSLLRVYSRVFEQASTPAIFIKNFYPYNEFMKILQGVLTATGIVTIVQIVRSNKK